MKRKIPYTLIATLQNNLFYEGEGFSYFYQEKSEIQLKTNIDENIIPFHEIFQCGFRTVMLFNALRYYYI